MNSTSDALTPAVVFLSRDLMFGSRVKAAAERAGWRFFPGQKWPLEIAGEVRFLIVDLSGCSDLVDDLLEACRGDLAGARLIAYGPHVHAAKLQAARAAGVQTVITRGQFDAGLSTMFDQPD